MSYPDRIPMNVDMMLRRARSQVGKVSYRLGAGGRDPTSSSCGTKYSKSKKRVSDCIGFACWAWGFSRYSTRFPVYGGWINTDSMVMCADDSVRSHMMLEWFTLLDAPVVGCFIVYPGIYAQKDPKDVKRSRVRIGHVGIVTEVVDGEPTKVIHCSSSKRGVAETDAALWKNKSSFKNGNNAHWRTRYIWPSWI